VPEILDLLSALLPGKVLVGEDISEQTIRVWWSWKGVDLETGWRKSVLLDSGAERLAAIIADALMTTHPAKDDPVHVAYMCKRGFQQCHVCQDWECGDNSNPDRAFRMDTDDMLTTKEIDCETEDPGGDS
jgi:hypothetical protein